jgi:lysyl-tRNA synthetase class I
MTIQSSECKHKFISVVTESEIYKSIREPLAHHSGNTRTVKDTIRTVVIFCEKCGKISKQEEVIR